MTRKDYVKIAALLNEEADTWRGQHLARYVQTFRVARRLADILAADNERFDRDRFLTASGFPEAAK